MRQFFCWQ